jgi:starch-binding outer membrane protein, SusD/RagB family
MKHIILNTVAAGVMLFGFTACADDLNIHSIDPQSSPTYDDAGLLAKQYATLGLTGQKGSTGNGDITMDEGESGFYRTTFNCNELSTDECIWAWQTDTDIPQFTNMSWSSSSKRTQWVYNRLGYDITQYNFYLNETANRTDLDGQRAEVRFLRALHYWYFLDLFHKAPFKTTFNIKELPVEKAGKALYDWIDQELTEIEPLMAEVGAYDNTENFGRADRGAAYMLHARLALNSAVYTDGETKDYQKAIDYCDKLINSGKYKLSSTAKTDPNGLTYSGYAQLFMADNDENADAMQEIIFPIRQDGLKTRNYSGSTYLVCSTRGAGMPYMGTTNGWTCNFSRGALVEKFFPTITDCPISTEAAPKGATESEIIALDQQDGTSTRQIIKAAGDDRAMFYAGRGGGVRKLKTDKITGFLDGLSIVKWDNHRLDAKATNDVMYPDVDIPLMRFAEVYLTRAEARFRLDKQTEALADLNVLRTRANAKQLTSINERTILDEWCREFYMEGRRRSDLVRFNCYTTKNYLWDWKGGVENGAAVDSHFNVYPIPDDDLSNNPNMTQNKGY